MKEPDHTNPTEPSGTSRTSGTGVPPVISERFARRHLPHWQFAGATYFLTWRCAAGVTLSGSERDIVLAAVLHWDRVRWSVSAAVVMPDHVHLLACPLPEGEGYWELGELLHSVKSFSAHEIAKRRRAAGAPAVVWQDERYDRWMRDEAELERTWGYLRANPVRAGLAGSADEYYWTYPKLT